ncbi:MAG TPA: hypothetical protein VEX18_18255, partial [Polyangiaceae bacterium]|nr:hypothetical protein [Polyangiaceae bacterium]
MLIAVMKLGDTAARSLFVLIALYTLPERTTGQFGLALTLIGFFAFLCGFERYADLQRRLVGKSTAEADQLILWAVRFFAVNHLLWTPVLLTLLLYWVDLEASLAGLCLIIA